MVKRKAFLFGAGASKGASTSTRPYPPPVMTELYDRLAVQFPDEWGPASRLARHADAFRTDFEAAFTEFVLQMPDTVSYGISPPTLNLLEGQRTLAIYFSQFTQDGDSEDSYSKLILALKKSGSLSSCVFGSLNYDCLFEQAAHMLGSGVDYSCSAMQATEVRVAKIHGSCNFVTPRLSQHDRALLSAPNVAYEKDFEPLHPIGLEARLRVALAPTRAQLPVMSQISPGKEHLLAPVKIQEYRNSWRAQTLAAEDVVIIGVSHNQNDAHILETVRALSVPIYYIGDEANAAKWKKENHHVKWVHAFFEQGLEKLVVDLGLR